MEKAWLSPVLFEISVTIAKICFSRTVMTRAKIPFLRKQRFYGTLKSQAIQDAPNVYTETIGGSVLKPFYFFTIHLSISCCTSTLVSLSEERSMALGNTVLSILPVRSLS